MATRAPAGGLRAVVSWTGVVGGAPNWARAGATATTRAALSSATRGKAKGRPAPWRRCEMAETKDMDVERLPEMIVTAGKEMHRTRERRNEKAMSTRPARPYWSRSRRRAATHWRHL